MKKQNKRNQFTRITLALLLILSMLGNTLILPAVAQESAMPADEPALPETPTTGEADTNSTAPTLPEPILLTAADVPEFISAAALEERGAVERMRSEETNMSSVIFRNSDGTRTMYMYGLPVKYTAADGTVRDKSTNLVSVSAAAALLSDQPVAETMAQMSTAQQTALQAELGILDAERAADTLHMLSTALTARGSSLSDMAYTTLDNDVYALFPTNLTEGMTLVFGEHSLRMTPATGMTMTAGGNVTKTTTASLSDADVTERLLYPNVFGPGTAVQYTPTLTGVKEEILLSYNVGKNSFDFLLETDGLVLTETNGQFVLVNPETEQQVGRLGEIIVFDSAGQIVRGNMTAQTIKDGQIYGVTVSVDEEFLANATYPVSIDPTFTVDSSALDVFQETRYLIEDTALYNHEDAWNYTFESHHYLGKVPYTGNNTYMGNVLYRFPVFYDVSVPGEKTTVSADTLISFKLHLKTITPGTSTGTWTLSAVPYLWDWDDSTRICSFQASCYYGHTSPLVSSIQNVPAQGTFEVDLTEYLEHWINVRDGNVTDTADFETGVAICYGGGDTLWIEPVGEDTYTYATYEYSVIPLNTPIYLNSKEMSTFLGVGTQNRTKLLAGRVEEIGQSITWEIVYRGDNLYSLHPNGNMGKYLAGDTLIKNEGDEDFDLFFDGLWRINSFQYGEVIFINECTDDVLMSDIDGTVITISGNGYTNYEKSWRVVRADAYREADDIQVVSTDIWLAPGEQYDLFQNLNLGNYHFVSKDDFNISVLATSVASLAGTTITAIEPNGFTNIGVYHIPTRETILITLRTTAIAEGAYFVRNAESKLYMTTDSLSVPGYVDQDLFLNSERQAWTLLHNGDGTYIIQTRDGTHVLTTLCSTLNNSEIWTMSYDTTNDQTQRWYIDLDDGMFLISPVSKGEQEFVLAGDEFNTSVQQRLFSSTSSYHAFWNLVPCREYTVYHYVDNAFITRVGYGWESLFTGYINDATRVIGSNFDLLIHNVIISEPYTSTADECKYGYEHNMLYLLMYSCPEGGGGEVIQGCDYCSEVPCSYHSSCSYCQSGGPNCLIHQECPHYSEDNSQSHTCLEKYTMVSNFHSDVGNPNDKRVTYVLWTGHMLRGFSKHDSKVRSSSYDSLRIVIMTPYSLTGSYYVNSTGVLAHELSHQINAGDHYCDKYDNCDKMDPNDPCDNAECLICVHGIRDENHPIPKCMMNDPKNYSNGNPYCYVCVNRINSRLDEIY